MKRTIRVAINGAGRIGRAVLRAFFENRSRFAGIDLVAMNDPHDPEVLCHLLRYDTVHGKAPFAVSYSADQGTLTCGDHTMALLASRDIRTLPWKDLGVDIVLECTGRFKSLRDNQVHLEAGAKQVIISAPGASDVETTMVIGANEETILSDTDILSIGSCSTNALAPILSVLQDHNSIQSGFMTSVHAYTKDQSLVDAHHKDLRRARAAACSIIPTKTGAAKAIGKVIPALQGKLDGYALRVPTANVSVLDINVLLERPCDAGQVRSWLTAAASQDKLGVIAVTNEPLVSCDFNHHPASSVVDLLQVQVVGSMVKLVVWYDNEWGFANRMLDAVQILHAGVKTARMSEQKEGIC